MLADRDAASCRIREAVPADGRQLRDLKRQTFRETFVEGPLAVGYAEKDIRAYEATAYDQRKIDAELADPMRRQWVAEDADGRLVAYVHVGPCSLPHEEALAKHAQIHQLYVTEAWQGTGLGRRLLDYAMDWIAVSMPGPIWLGVYSGNLRAQAVYVSRGFEKMGEYEFPVGDHIDREFILRYLPR